ncbi:DinB family protein [Ilumatobacter sp.]|uniref:DinB family protein n=1 Tax=Ilumatobacter sp. TaxID=1967498 RepID=UPI003AF9A24A
MARIVPLLGDEQESLLAALERHRDAILWKLDGLTDEQLRTSTLPSGMTPIGLVKHLASVEYGWFCATFDRPHEPLGFDLDDENADFRVAPDESTDDVLAFWARARDAAGDAVAEIDLDTTGTAWFGEPVSMRWVMIHMVEELARHAGHMDIMRELVDGTTGDHDRS